MTFTFITICFLIFVALRIRTLKKQTKALDDSSIKMMSEMTNLKKLES